MTIRQKNSSDILVFESRLKQKEDLTTELEREASFNRGNYYYNQQSYFFFEPKSKSYDRNRGVINNWILTEIHNDSKNNDLVSVKNITDPYSKVCLPNAIKNISVKYLISQKNE